MSGVKRVVSFVVPALGGIVFARDQRMATMRLVSRAIWEWELAVYVGQKLEYDPPQVRGKRKSCVTLSVYGGVRVSRSHRTTRGLFLLYLPEMEGRLSKLGDDDRRRSLEGVGRIVVRMV